MDLSEIIADLIKRGVPPPEANALVARLLVIGAEAAVYRKETAASVADFQARQQQARRAN